MGRADFVTYLRTDHLIKVESTEDCPWPMARASPKTRHCYPLCIPELYPAVIRRTSLDTAVAPWGNAAATETALTKTRSYRHWIECAPYSDVKTCTKEYHPLCATNGCTYCNECFFCDALKPEKMAFFSSRVRALFILVLVLPLCSETGFARSKKTRKEPDCDVYRSHLFFCTREMDPICGTNGKSYANPCIFCSEKLGRNEKFDFGHWGHCREYTSAARS
ncbi:sperm-associated acrosin inhibitor isoform X4 [Sus scrofa]|uniref:sperm-associated acrosin inhibitor isoform X4 n=1 Tax=Sus scrofa TaxID=9823 RepID=UPI000A2B696D|nr:sperm-associated acrosin inhibitor isoform X4 [Sus scrofa]